MRSILTFFLLAFSIAINAQEQVMPLVFNSHLPARTFESFGPEANGLPFLDDFSYASKYPDQSKWEDSLVFINSTYPIKPPSIGVATFDGLTAEGMPYSIGSSQTGPADTLTSQPIDMTGLTAGDDVYMSFFYQAGGRGNVPETKDSLILEFKVNDSAWVSVWKAEVNNAPKEHFDFVIFHIDQPEYLTGDFQFRFRNYATLGGNNDHWHVDYIHIDDNRSSNDIYLNDVAFQYSGKSLLKNYYAMPLYQFKGFEDQELADSIFVFARNNFNSVELTNFRYSAYEDCNNSQIANLPIESVNFPALSDTSLRDPNYITAIKNTVASNTCDSLVITTKYELDNPSSSGSAFYNDTIYHHQRFYNYLAYDDGSAEKAYGLIGAGANLAYKFTLNKTDTIRAIQIHWAHVNKDLSSLLFSLKIWGDIDAPSGANETILYQQDFLNLKYARELNGYFTYFLDSAVVVPAGTFYIGWLQSQEQNLKIGLDQNTNANPDHVYFNVGGGWVQSTIEGSIMMRPVFGDPGTYYTGSEKPVLESDLTVYPNPATDMITINGQEGSDYEIYDKLGRRVKIGKLNSSQIQIADLQNGLYILQVSNRELNSFFRTKFIKQ